MKSIILLIFINFFLFASDVNIAVAANVSYAMDELKKEFKKSFSQTNLHVILGSSGKLSAQIQNGASFDIFMSANMFYPTKLYQNKLAITKPKVYAKGMLALFSTKKRDFSKGMDILLQNDIHTIAIANPKTAPYGKAAKEVLKNLSIYKKIKHKLIYGESISQTVAYAINAADIAIISKSALFSPKLSRFEQGVNWICIDSKLYQPINQGIVLLKNAKNNHDAKLFYDFILHNKNAKKILKKYGYEIF